MSDIRPLSLRTVEPGVRRPAWIEAAKAKVERAPFDPRPPFGDGEQEAAEREAQSEARTRSVAPQRRSSLPPRKSVPPPPVVITRLPPPPADLLQAAGPGESEHAFAEAALELGSLRARVIGSVEGQLLELAVGIAKALIEREVSLDPSLLAVFAKAALTSLGDTTECRLRVSRMAYQSLTEQYGGPAVDVDGVRVNMVLDHSLEGLGVVAETPGSRVDGRLDERLSSVLRAIEAEHRRQGAEDEP
ncbi:MAG: Flagellar assembly protein FliH [Pseudomonadota bacterium]